MARARLRAGASSPLFRDRITLRVEEPQRPVRGLADAHPRAHAHPPRRPAVAQVEPALLLEEMPSAEGGVDVERAAEPARSGSRSRLEAEERLRGADEHAARRPL